MGTVYFITHPEVDIDPLTPVPGWSLSERGRERMEALATRDWVDGLQAFFSSAERKAVEGAQILVRRRGLSFRRIPELGENDRSATGYLPPVEFARMARAFFEHPDECVRGWESARAAQERILTAVERILHEQGEQGEQGDLALVSHGGVGTLLLCSLAGASISLEHDQPGAGGGNYFAFCAGTRRLFHGWRPIEEDPG